MPDIRRTVRSAIRAGGEPIERHPLGTDPTPARFVLLLDVSGSMEPYARALLRFVHAAVAGRQQVEAFALGTRLTRITRELTSRDPDIALRAAGERVTDWSGGTRLGAGCASSTTNGVCGAWPATRSWSSCPTAGIVATPRQLGEQMERLHRVTHRVVWVNPLKATPGYAPLARGMAAALPYVDDFVEGHSRGGHGGTDTSDRRPLT